MEEYQEAQQRQDFLSAQRQDLLDSIRDTEKAIADIDQVSRNRFAEAFERINENFREAFQTLFGGGTGEMRLTGETTLANSAPLDEANIERLTRLLREMSAQTQFIVITHSKKTMEAASAMYGVTMQEPGVSKLVSVKFQPAAA
jgi:chromosome segregation protein